MLKSMHLLVCGVAMAASSSMALSAPILSSSAQAAAVDVKVANVVAAHASLAPVSGTAAPDYSDHGQLASINVGAHVSTNLLTSADLGVTSGIVTTLAESTYPDSVMATANIANAKAGLYTTVLNAIPLAAIGISADAISSTTVAGIDASGLFATGASSFANLAITGSILDGIGLDLAAFVNPLPNTVGLSVLGLKITFNEQLTSQTADSIAMTTNAVHISLSDYLFGGKLLNGDVILGQSHASITGYAPSAPVPEPATWALMIGGFALAGLSLRRARGRLAFA